MDDGETYGWVRYGEAHEVQEEVPQEQKERGAYSRLSSFSRKASVFLYCFAIFILPFIFLPIAGLSVSSSKILLVSFLVSLSGVAYVYSTQHEEIFIPKTFFSIIGAFLVLLFLSTIFSESFNASFIGSLQGGAFYALFFGMITALLGSLVISTPKRLIIFFGSFLAGVGLLGLFHIIRLIFGADTLSFGIFQSTTATPAGSWYDLAVIFGLVYLVALAGIVFGSLPKQLNLVLTAMLFLALIFLVLIHFNILLIILSGLSLGIFLLSLRERIKGGRALILISLVVLIGGAVFHGPLGNITERVFAVNYSEVRPSMRSTTEIIDKKARDIKLLLLGNGPNTFSYLWRNNRNSEVVESDFWAVDFAFAASTFLTYFLTLGGISIFVFLIWLVYIISLAFSSAQAHGSNPFLLMAVRSSALVAICILFLGIFYVFGVVSFFLLCAFSGVAVSARTLAKRARTTSLEMSSENGTYAFNIGLTLFIACTIFVLITTTGRVLYGEALKEAVTIKGVSGFASVDAKLALATKLERSDELYRTRAELALREAQSYFTLDEKDITDQERDLFNNALIRAQDYAEKATNIDPRNYQNWVTKGLILETLGVLKVEGAFDEAAKAYNAAREEYPTNPEILLMQARLEESRDDTAKAVSYIEEAIKMKRSYVGAYVLLANIQHSHGADAKAISALEEGVRANPNNQALLYEQGALYYTLKRYKKATESFDKAIKIDPNYANALYFRGLAFYYLGDRSAALGDLEKVLETNQSNKDLKKVISNIKSGNDPFLGLNKQTDTSKSLIDSTKKTQEGGASELQSNESPEKKEGEVLNLKQNNSRSEEDTLPKNGSSSEGSADE